MPGRVNRAVPVTGSKRSFIDVDVDGTVHVAAEAALGDARWIRLAPKDGAVNEQPIPELSSATSVVAYGTGALLLGPAPDQLRTRSVRYDALSVQQGMCEHDNLQTNPTISVPMGFGQGIILSDYGWTWLFGNNVVAGCVAGIPNPTPAKSMPCSSPKG